VEELIRDREANGDFLQRYSKARSHCHTIFDYCSDGGSGSFQHTVRALATAAVIGRSFTFALLEARPMTWQEGSLIPHKRINTHVVRPQFGQIVDRIVEKHECLVIERRSPHCG
jgi:hypothetical protein